MASSYVNDLRLNEMATGDASGTWGDTTNTNLELIGEALGYGTEGITTNADTHTTTVADGATDPGRAMYIEYTGTLDSACTITIAPNTVNRMHFIENGTSGSQNIIIKQGSGATITIPPGDTKAVYLDGAGSGAAVVDAFASLSVVDLKVQDDLTVTDDMTVGGTLGVTGTVTLAGDIDLAGGIDVDGTSNLDIVDIDGAVDMATTAAIGTFLTFGGGVATDTGIKFDGNAVDYYLALDDSTDKLTLGANGATVGSTVSLTIDENGAFNFPDNNITMNVSGNSDNLTLSCTDADANSGPNLRMYRNSGSPADDDVLGQIDFEGRNNNSQDVVYGMINTRIMATTDGSEDSNMYMYIMKSGTQRLALMLDRTEAVFNDDSQDINFRVESNGSTHMLFVDAGDNTVLMSSNPDSDTQSTPHDTLKLAVAYSGSGSDGAAGLGPRLVFSIPDDEDNPSVGGGIAVVKESADDSNSVAAMTFATSQNDQTLDEAMRFTSSGQLLLGTTSNNSDSYKMIVDTGGGAKGIDVRNVSFNSDNGAFRSVPPGNTSYRFAVMLNSSNNTVGKIEVTSNSTTYTTSSDYRLKENIITLENGLARLNQLKPVKFNWIESGQEEEGFIAHEVDEIFSDAVTGEKDAVQDNGTVSPQTMDYGRITPLLVKAIQEQQEQIEQLKTEISKLH